MIIILLVSIPIGGQNSEQNDANSGRDAPSSLYSDEQLVVEADIPYTGILGTDFIVDNGVDEYDVYKYQLHPGVYHWSINITNYQDDPNQGNNEIIIRLYSSITQIYEKELSFEEEIFITQVPLSNENDYFLSILGFDFEVEYQFIMQSTEIPLSSLSQNDGGSERDTSIFTPFPVELDTMYSGEIGPDYFSENHYLDDEDGYEVQVDSEGILTGFINFTETLSEFILVKVYAGSNLDSRNEFASKGKPLFITLHTEYDPPFKEVEINANIPEPSKYVFALETVTSFSTSYNFSLSFENSEIQYHDDMNTGGDASHKFENVPELELNITGTGYGGLGFFDNNLIQDDADCYVLNFPHEAAVSISLSRIRVPIPSNIHTGSSNALQLDFISREDGFNLIDSASDTLSVDNVSMYNEIEAGMYHICLYFFHPVNYTLSIHSILNLTDATGEVIDTIAGITDILAIPPIISFQLLVLLVIYSRKRSRN